MGVPSCQSPVAKHSQTLASLSRLPKARLRPGRVGTRLRRAVPSVSASKDVEAPPANLRAFLASNPVLNGSFQTHDRFGWLEFAR